jgi:hypothetical protein
MLMGMKRRNKAVNTRQIDQLIQWINSDECLIRLKEHYKESFIKRIKEGTYSNHAASKLIKLLIIEAIYQNRKFYKEGYNSLGLVNAETKAKLTDKLIEQIELLITFQYQQQLVVRKS